MFLLDPNHLDRPYPDARSAEIMRKTVEFFESKGKTKLLADYYDRPWYADFLEFVKKERIFASMCAPAGEGAPDARWDTWRICEFAEILGFYGLQYWYTWQVSVLGLGPIWMSDNAGVKRKTAQLLEDGAIFAFGLGAARAPVALGLLAVGGISAFFSLVAPKANLPLFVGLSILAFPIGFVLSYVILGFLFYGVITPIGMIMRVFGRDPLLRSFDGEQTSYWSEPRPSRGKESYFKQF